MHWYEIRTIKGTYVNVIEIIAFFCGLLVRNIKKKGKYKTRVTYETSDHYCETLGTITRYVNTNSRNYLGLVFYALTSVPHSSWHYFPEDLICRQSSKTWTSSNRLGMIANSQRNKEGQFLVNFFYATCQVLKITNTFIYYNLQLD